MFDRLREWASATRHAMRHSTPARSRVLGMPRRSACVRQIGQADGRCVGGLRGVGWGKLRLAVAHADTRQEAILPTLQDSKDNVTEGLNWENRNEDEGNNSGGIAGLDDVCE